jgi:Flp pilus assembly protein TadD
VANSKNPRHRAGEHNERGISLADRGWFEEAEREFRKAIECDPNAAYARDNLAMVLVERGDLLAALAEYVRAWQLDPESPDVYHYLATFLATHGTDAAVAGYRHALSLEEEYPEAHLNLGLTLADRGEWDEALKEMNIAYAQAPDDESIRHELACCLIDAGQYSEAIGHLRAIVRAHPEHIEAYVDLGVAYMAQGFFAEAEGILKKALDIEAEHPDTHYQLGALYCAWDRPDRTFEHLELALSLDRERLLPNLDTDPVFDTLRDHPRWLELTGAHEADV